MKKTTLLVVTVAVLMLSAAGSWADFVITGKYLKVGVDYETASLWTDTGTGSNPGMLGVKLDSTGSYNFTSAVDWLTPEASNQFSFWSIEGTGFNSGNALVDGWSNTAGGSAGSDPVGVLGGGWTFTNNTVGADWDLKWSTTIKNSSNYRMRVDREFFFSADTDNYFLWTTTLTNLETTTGHNLTGLYYATGFDPGPGLPGTANTLNTYTPQALGYNDLQSRFYSSVSDWEYISMYGKANPYLTGDAVYTTDPSTIYAGPPGANNTNNDANIEVGFIGGSNNSTTLGPRESAGLTTLYTFGKGKDTPELGTFALMGISMLPLGGIAIRRRRRSA
jgi:hypothetical protein